MTANPVPYLSDLLLFILMNRNCTKAFQNWKPIDIINGTINALKNNCCVVDKNYIGGIQGLLLGYPIHEEKKLHICEILTSKNSTGTVKRMLVEYSNRYPDYKIQAMRKGKLVVYENMPRLVALLTLLSK